MIEAKKLLRMIRYKLGDNDERDYSDYDIKNALNEALRHIGQAQAMQNSDYLEVANHFNQDELNSELIMEGNEEGEDYELYDFRLKGIDLPEDFSTLAGVTDIYGRDMRPCDITKIPNPRQYKIMGNKIYTGLPAFTLTYKKTIDEVKDLENDSVELPNLCTDLIIKTTCLILKQAETDVLLKLVEQTARALIPRRRYNNPEIKMPFYC